MSTSSRFSCRTGSLKALAAPFALPANSRKTERVAKRFFLSPVVRAAPFSLPANSRKTERVARPFSVSLVVRAASFALLAAVCVHAQAPATFPLLKSCGEGSETVTSIGSSDPVKIRYSFNTDTGTCYAVTATIDGKTVDGYLAGARPGNGPAHPAIMAFEQEIRTHVPQIPAPPPPAPTPPAAAKAAAPQPAVADASQKKNEEAPLPLSFAGFRAVDIKGNRVDLSSKRTPNIVVYFWSALDQRGIKKAEAMYGVYEHFHTRGVEVVGIASARNATQLLQVCTDSEFVWSDILDSGGIANRYHVDPAKPYLLLDQSRRVIAAVESPSALEPILDQLTRGRRVSR
jgi:peroxiredoxin